MSTQQREAGTAYQSDAFAGTTYQRPRPKRHDKAILRQAAEALVPEIEEWLGESVSGREREELIGTLEWFATAHEAFASVEKR